VSTSAGASDATASGGSTVASQTDRIIDPEAFGVGVEGAVDRYVAMTRATSQLVALRSS